MSNRVFIMPPKRKNNSAYVPTKISVKGHTRTVYKRKKFHISNFVKKKKKRGGSVALGKAVGEILWSVGKDQAKNFYNTARQRANEHAERIKRLYYYNN